MYFHLVNLYIYFTYYYIQQIHTHVYHQVIYPKLLTFILACFMWVVVHGNKCKYSSVFGKTFIYLHKPSSLHCGFLLHFSIFLFLWSRWKGLTVQCLSEKECKRVSQSWKTKTDQYLTTFCGRWRCTALRSFSPICIGLECRESEREENDGLNALCFNKTIRSHWVEVVRQSRLQQVNSWHFQRHYTTKESFALPSCASTIICQSNRWPTSCA